MMSTETAEQVLVETAEQMMVVETAEQVLVGTAERILVEAIKYTTGESINSNNAQIFMRSHLFHCEK